MYSEEVKIYDEETNILIERLMFVNGKLSDHEGKAGRVVLDLVTKDVEYYHFKEGIITKYTKISSNRTVLESAQYLDGNLHSYENHPCRIVRRRNGTLMFEEWRYHGICHGLTKVIYDKTGKKIIAKIYYKHGEFSYCESFYKRKIILEKNIVHFDS